MSDTTHGEDELFVTPSDEATSSDASTTKESVDELLDEESKESPNKDANTVRSEEIARWQRKIESGEITPDQVPPKQQWVLKHIESKKTVKSEDPRAIFKEELANMKDSDRFDTIKAQLNSVALNNGQKLALQATYKEFTGHGLPRSKALDAAIRLAGIDLTDHSAKRDAMKVPVPGYVGNQSDEDFVPYKFEGDQYKGPQGTSEERVAANEKLRKGGQVSKADKYRTVVK